MNKCKISIWGREFVLPVIYECYDGEEVIESQKEAFTQFKENSKKMNDSLEWVKQYIKKTSDAQQVDNEIENVFKFVIPKSIFIPHRKSHLTVAIMCNYKFDMEHGIAVIFEKGRFKEIGSQDIVL